MSTAIVTGANSGIGHAFAKILVDEGLTVYAIDKTIGDPLMSLDCTPVQLDITDARAISEFAAVLGDNKIDILLNIAGIMEEPSKDALDTVDLSVLQKTFAVNTFGPLLLTQAVLPNLLKSEKPRVGFMSSRVGSMADNSSGGSYAYRASKAALNSICKSLSMNLKENRVVVVIMHPGYVKTGLDTTKKTHEMKQAVLADEAARKLWEIFKSRTLEDSGIFYHREGYTLPW